MPNAAELIKEVYIDPIKSVLFIDDKFPTYADTIQFSYEENRIDNPELLKLEDDEQNKDLFASKSADGVHYNEINEKGQDLPADNGVVPMLPDARRALNLTQSCRERGYIFDVENSAEIALKYQDETSFVNKADLVVLDYVLDEKSGSGQDALQIIDRLNNTTRFNLIVVYTNNDPTEVGHEIAYFLRGKKPEEAFSAKAQRPAGGMTEDHIRQYLPEYLSGKIGALTDWFRALNLEGTPLEKDIRFRFEDYLRRYFFQVGERESSTLTACGFSKEQIPWICGKAVFIAVVHKGAEEVSVNSFLEILTNCLRSYVPSPIAMLIHKSINTLKEGGSELLERAFGQPAMRAALLYRAMSVEDREINFRLVDLMTRAFSMLSVGIQERVSVFGNSLLGACVKACDGQSMMAVASEMEKVVCHDETEMFLNMNAYLCSQPIETSYLTTGSIFQQCDDASHTWICVTPACDMVPSRRGGNGIDYRNRIAPANYFEACRIVEDDNIKKALKEANNAYHIFIEIDGKVKAYRMLHDTQKMPKNYIFFSDNGCAIADGVTPLHLVDFVEGGGVSSFVCKTYQVKIIGQLRPEYASRILTIKGGWNSRIGVDFVPYAGA